MWSPESSTPGSWPRARPGSPGHRSRAAHGGKTAFTVVAAGSGRRRPGKGPSSRSMALWLPLPAPVRGHALNAVPGSFHAPLVPLGAGRVGSGCLSGCRLGRLFGYLLDGTIKVFGRRPWPTGQTFKTPQFPVENKKARGVASGLREVERRRAELPTSSLRTNARTSQTPAKQGNSEQRSENADESADTGRDNPSLLTRLLAELAALPPEQRAALAELIRPTPPAPATGKHSDCPDDRLPWEREQGEGESH